ncbi:MAG: cytosine deaminase [Pseudomonadota bacterium]
MKLLNAAVPSTFLTEGGAADLTLVDITLDGGRIASVDRTAREMQGPASDGHDCAGGVVVPAFIDVHTHLDSVHIAARTGNADGTFQSALSAVLHDRQTHWTHEEILNRMNFAVEAAYAYGTAAIRTHVNARRPLAEKSWSSFEALREMWAGKMTLQPASLSAIGELEGDLGPHFDEVARHKGVVGAFIYPMHGIAGRIEAVVAAAEDRGVDLDFHVDETLDPTSDHLADIAKAAIAVKFSGTITCGHCCSLMAMEEAKSARILDLVAEAGIAIVSLPMCNQYLQHRDPAARRTPRIRGGTLVHEMVARGIRVAFGSDNVCDPFYAYGDLDMAEVWREATRILHLDHPVGDWPRAFSATPAAIMGLPDRDAIAPGAPADFVIFKGRSFGEHFARPLSERTVIRDGVIINPPIPDYERLDALVGAPN